MNNLFNVYITMRVVTLQDDPIFLLRNDGEEIVFDERSDSKGTKCSLEKVDVENVKNEESMTKNSVCEEKITFTCKSCGS